MEYTVETQISNWNWIAFILGLIIGSIILILIVWLTYSQRWIFFSSCRVGNPTCKLNDYYTLEEAFKNGFPPEDILEVNSNGVLLYKRVPKNSECYPGSNQSTPVLYPKLCAAKINGIERTFTLQKEPTSKGETAIYKNGDTTNESSRNCQPISPFVESARPIPNFY